MLPVVLYIFVQLTCCNTFNINLNHTAVTPKFCLLSSVVAYSLCFYILVKVSLYCNVTDRMATILDRREFDYKIYIILLIFIQHAPCSRLFLWHQIPISLFFTPANGCSFRLVVF